MCTVMWIRLYTDVLSLNTYLYIMFRAFKWDEMNINMKKDGCAIENRSENTVQIRIFAQKNLF